MFDRLGGIFTFQAPIYREVADDTSATGEAALILLIVAIISDVIQQVLFPRQDTSVTSRFSQFGVVLVGSLIFWIVDSWLLAWVSTGWFEGRTNTSKMLRVTGFASIFSLLSLIPIIGSLLALLLGFLGGVISVREAAEVTTGKAVAIYLITIFIIVAAILIVVLCASAGTVWLGGMR